MSTFKHAFNTKQKNEMVTWIDAMRSHLFYLATDVLQAALRVRDRSENEGSMSSSLFSQDSVQTENVEYSQKEEKWDISISPTHTSLYIYIYISPKIRSKPKMWSTPKRKKNGIYQSLPLTHLFIYIYIYISHFSWTT